MKKKKFKKVNESFKSKTLSLSIEDKWLKRKDVAILASILLIIILAIVKIHKPTYNYKTIYLEKKVSTLKEAIKLTDTQALKIDKKVNIAPGIKATNLMRMIFYMIKAS